MKVENGYISNISFLSFRTIFHWTMIMGERVTQQKKNMDLFQISKWVITPIYPIYMSHLITNHFPTSWDIQAGISFRSPTVCLQRFQKPRGSAAGQTRWPAGR